MDNGARSAPPGGRETTSRGVEELLLTNCASNAVGLATKAKVAAHLIDATVVANGASTVAVIVLARAERVGADGILSRPEGGFALLDAFATILYS